MIIPYPRDVGRKVIYRAGHPGAEPERGTISSIPSPIASAQPSVFVRYGNELQGKLTPCANLEWDS